ncbi:MAG: hypothetical protein D8B52_02360 [Prevotella sp.]|nr:MAG: hypothetical protein D8B52_02360 [Prevotella sp.]
MFKIIKWEGKKVQKCRQHKIYTSSNGLEKRTQNRQVSFAQYVSTFRVIPDKTLHVENKLVNLRENYNTVNK